MNATPRGITRRQWLKTSLISGAAVLSGAGAWQAWKRHAGKAPVAIVKAANYSAPLHELIRGGLHEAGVTGRVVKGLRILLKPNLVEVDRSAPHVNTHPLVVRAAVDVFYQLGAASVTVAEGAGHCMDSIFVYERSGLREALKGSGARFVDLNYQTPFLVENRFKFSSLPHLAFPGIFKEVDWIVSMPKLKTHHWAGVTLSMKNLFGTLPGCYYGWPKNVLHHAGLNESIADIALTLRPQLAIVDGIVGMEGDGPIMGDPVPAGLLVIGTELPAVDATCARLMAIDPAKVRHLQMAASAGFLTEAGEIELVGEAIAHTQKQFKLLPEIPAQSGIRLIT